MASGLSTIPGRFLLFCVFVLLCIVSLTDCGGSVFGPCFVIKYLMSYSCCNHLDVDEKAGCANLNVYPMYCDC